MDVIEKATAMSYHRRRLKEDPSKALGWKDLDSQQMRFEALSNIGDLNDSVIMDMGCGYGDFKAHLDKKFNNFIYLGIDHMPEFINEATRRFQHCKSTYFHHGDFMTDGFPQVDYIFASGALCYQSGNHLFPYTIIRKMYTAAKKGVAFNLLDDEFFTSDNFLKAYNRYEILSFCLRLATRAELVTGYLPDDFTIMMYK